MTGLLLDHDPTMTGRRTEPDDRPRLDLRIEPELRDRIRLASIQVLGKENLSAYIRMAVLERLTRDELAREAPRRRRKPKDD